MTTTTEGKDDRECLLMMGEEVIAYYTVGGAAESRLAAVEDVIEAAEGGGLEKFWDLPSEDLDRAARAFLRALGLSVRPRKGAR